jgi:hypothetical protein
MLFDRSSPPPFYQAQLSDLQRQHLDRTFIGTRSTNHYLARFASFDQAQCIGIRWHWAAFAMTLPWLLYRKRYLDGLVYAVAGWSFVHVLITLSLVICENIVLPFLPTDWHWPIRFGLGGSLFLIWCILTAGWADAYYYRVARREISETFEDQLNNEQQHAHLQQHGGVSLIGGGLAAVLFGFALATIYTVYLPLYSTYQSRQKLLAVYDVTVIAKQRVDQIYQATHQCPIGLPLSTSQQNQRLATIMVHASSHGLPDDTICVVEATIRGAHWPIHQLNDEKLSFYYQGGRWHCLTSISQRETPRGCLLD